MQIVLLRKKLSYIFELKFDRVKMEDPDDNGHEEEQVRYDPSGTVNIHLERRTDMEDAYGKAVVSAERRRFGFGR